MNRTLLLHLSLIEGIGPATIEKLIQRLDQNQIDQLYDYGVGDLVECGLKAPIAQLIVDGLANRAALTEELALVEKLDVTWTTVFDADYPQLLKQTYLPPIIIYWQGRNPASFDKCIAFVGSRQAQNYCQKIARALIPTLIDSGFTMVSGGVLGADTIAHTIALEHAKNSAQSTGSTVAVIGSGLAKPYPASNSSLFRSIIKNNGCVMSPFPLRAPAQPGNFPARNRIISGLSVACVVLQAAQKSGALITASYALEQGREVGAVPGAFDDPLSIGCHNLLRQGAHVITCPDDIFAMLGYATDSAQKSVVDNNSIDKSSDNSGDPLLMAAIRPISFDDLIAITGHEAAVLHDKLFQLQIEGKIKQDFAGLWKAV